MAANCARRTLQFSSASAKTVLSGSSFSSGVASKATKFSGFASAKPSSSTRFSLQNLALSRLPVELSGAQSLMPLHSVTASALLTSLLSLNSCSWGCLSEGFGSTL